MIRVILADDELLARKRLERLLAAMPRVELVASCESGEQVLQCVATNPADILLLDIQMPGLSGLETSTLVPKGGPRIVFVTAHPEHALKAFDVGAVDYVVKPVDPARLQTAIERAVSRGGKENHKLAVETSRGIVMVDPATISHLAYDGYLVTIHAGDQFIATTLSLTELEQKLATANFRRVHRRHILNMDRVARLEPLPSGGYTAHTGNGDQVPISRATARELRKRYEL